MNMHERICKAAIEHKATTGNRPTRVYLGLIELAELGASMEGARPSINGIDVYAVQVARHYLYLS